jgi:hypothetical protein
LERARIVTILATYGECPILRFCGSRHLTVSSHSSPHRPTRFCKLPLPVWRANILHRHVMRSLQYPTAWARYRAGRCSALYRHTDLLRQCSVSVGSGARSAHIQRQRSRLYVRRHCSAPQYPPGVDVQRPQSPRSPDSASRFCSGVEVQRSRSPDSASLASIFCSRPCLASRFCAYLESFHSTQRPYAHALGMFAGRSGKCRPRD